jgi:uncharacterized protein (UPF0332 family)
MTDKEALAAYRRDQARETLVDAERMLKEHYSSRSIINRAYYAMFYSLLALYLKSGTETKTSRHAGIISMFDKEFVQKGLFDKRFSKMLHVLFDKRQECDYKEFIQVSYSDAEEAVRKAREFFNAVSDVIKNNI